MCTHAHLSGTTFTHACTHARTHTHTLTHWSKSLSTTTSCISYAVIRMHGYVEVSKLLTGLELELVTTASTE